MNNIRRNQQGFTLIELMIVIAILAILLAIAIPAYQDYAVRAKVSECLNASAPIKLAIAEYSISAGETPDDASEAGIDENNITNLEYCDGVTYTATSDTVATLNISADAGAVGADSATIEFNLVGTYDEDSGVAWECDRANTPAADTKYLPAECRTATT